MLLKPELTAFLSTENPQNSKQFYMNTLGLKLISEDDYALEFRANKTLLRITVVQDLEPQPFTVLGFRIEEITSQVKTLVDKGVKFEKYESLNQDPLGIWTSPNEARIAWFKDPDGNILSITQLPIKINLSEEGSH